MADTPSVTQWLRRLEVGDSAAAEALWQRYITRLVRLARDKLRGARPRVADEEDVALSALDSFFRGAARGRFPQLHDRSNLWALLVTLTERKASNLVKHERRQKRGAGRVAGESALPRSPGRDPGFDQIASPEPTPAFAAEMAEECRRLMGLLDEEMRELAQGKLEGYTNAELAARLGCAEVTVERRLRLIRKRWQGEVSP